MSGYLPHSASEFLATPQMERVKMRQFNTSPKQYESPCASALEGPPQISKPTLGVPHKQQASEAPALNAPIVQRFHMGLYFLDSNDGFGFSNHARPELNPAFLSAPGCLTFQSRKAAAVQATARQFVRENCKTGEEPALLASLKDF
jgi:hypothetical protein